MFATTTICNSSFQPTVCYYITHLSSRFLSSTSIHNYISGICMLHIQLDLTPTALEWFPVKALLKAAAITTCTPLAVRRLSILPDLLAKLCTLSYSLQPLAQGMKVCLTFGFFGMLPLLHQSTVTWHLPRLPHMTLLCMLAGVMSSSATQPIHSRPTRIFWPPYAPPTIINHS